MATMTPTMIANRCLRMISPSSFHSSPRTVCWSRTFFVLPVHCICPFWSTPLTCPLCLENRRRGGTVSRLQNQIRAFSQVSNAPVSFLACFDHLSTKHFKEIFRNPRSFSDHFL